MAVLRAQEKWRRLRDGKGQSDFFLDSGLSFPCKRWRLELHCLYGSKLCSTPTFLSKIQGLLRLTPSQSFEE